MQKTAYLALQAKTYRLVTASMMETACQRGSQIRDDQAKAQILSYGKNTKRRLKFSMFLNRTVKSGRSVMAGELKYGRICSVEELGRLARAHRKNGGQTLKRIADLTNVSLRFLSEFERGKETAEIGKVLQALRILGLEVVIQPRAEWNIAQKAAFISARKTNPAVTGIEQPTPKGHIPAEDEG